jgi:hypothetical protein
MTDARPHFAGARLRVCHAVSQGVNFCYYLLGKAQLRLPALARAASWPAPDADPFSDFARRFETALAPDLDPAQVDPLWRSWLRRVVEMCPDVAADALSALPELPARPEARNAFQRLARMQLGDFIERWPGAALEMDARLEHAVRSFDVARVLGRHQETLGVEYRPGIATFHYHLLRVFSVSRFGLSVVVGSAFLDRADRLADAVTHETLHALVEQTDTWRREEMRPLLAGLRPLLAGSYLQPADAIAEAVCAVIGVLERDGEAAPLERIEGRLPHAALRVIARALYEHRRARHAQGFAPWVAAAVQQAQRGRARPRR